MLTIQDVGVSKAEAVAARLRLITPNITATHGTQKLPGNKAELESLIEKADVVIDCTASDHVLTTLKQGWWSVPKLFVSMSLGYMGKRMFLYLIDDCSFPMEDFRQKIDPWLECEKHQQSISEEINEGAGCWSPLFPCRFDDVLLAASMAVKVIEKAACARPFRAGLFVYEQQKNGLGITSFNLTASPDIS